jgi:hypothetical protein
LEIGKDFTKPEVMMRPLLALINLGAQTPVLAMV